MDSLPTPHYTDFAHLIHAFIALQITGGALFVLVTISAFIAQRRGGSRHATFFSFCFAWIVFCVSYSLLYIAAQQAARPAPEPMLCTVQAALVYAAPPLSGSATVSLVTHLLLNILLALSRTADKKRSFYTSATLVIVPWVIWIAVFIGVLLFGLHHPEFVDISPNGTFCVLIDTSLPKLTSIWAALASIVLLTEEATIAILLYRNREVFAGFGQSLTMAIRVGIFTILGIGGIVVALVFTITMRRGVQFDVVIATIPPGAAIIFGSQMDILRVWVFWKKYETVNEPQETRGSAVLSTVLSSSVASTPTQSLRRGESV